VSFAYLPCDATYVKARVSGRVVSRAVVVASGVAEDASREVLGIAIDASEDGIVPSSSSP
jgi:putative transposase